jgi:hypothetical protein
VVPTLLAFGAALVWFTLLCQFSVWQYGRGAVRAAAQEAARAGAPLGATEEECLRRFDQVRSGLLGGRLGSGIGHPRCDVAGPLVEVTVEVTFERWLPISPDWSFSVTALAVKEEPL